MNAYVDLVNKAQQRLAKKTARERWAGMAPPPCGEEAEAGGGSLGKTAGGPTRLRPSPLPNPSAGGGAQMAPHPLAGRRPKAGRGSLGKTAGGRHGCVRAPSPTPSRRGGGQTAPPPLRGRRPKAGGGSLGTSQPSSR